MAKFTYNDIVRAKPTADRRARPGERAWVVAVLENREQFPLKQFPVGIIYSIEFEDGNAIDVHENDLELVERVG
jgi:hypothetical protein